jgi:hypothetical protein
MQLKPGMFVEPGRTNPDYLQDTRLIALDKGIVDATGGKTPAV